MKNKKGISLIVLVITIIVIVVLATAVIVSLARNNPVENANEATFKGDLANVKDLVNLTSTDILLKKVEDNADAYKGIIPPEYETKIDIENGILYYIGQTGQEEKWAKEIGVIRKKDIPKDWIDIAENTPENGISLLIGKPDLEEATIKFKVTSTGGYKVDWGDGTSNSYGSEVEAIHTYSTNNDKLSTDGYLFQINITPDGGEITRFRHTQTNNSPLLWCQVGCNTLTDCTSMLDEAKNLKKFGTASKTSLSQVTKMIEMFIYCISLESVPYLETSNVEYMDFMFQGCSSLKTIPEMNTNKVKFMMQMFFDCSSIENIPKLDTSNAISVRSMFDYCDNLKSINMANTNLTSEQINDVFDMLPISKNKAEIDITENPGASKSTRSIATDKGWTVIY